MSNLDLRYREVDLEEQYMEIAAKITGADALSDYVNGQYERLPELLAEHFNNISSPKVFNRLKGKMEEINLLLLDLMQKIEINHKMATHTSDLSWNK